MDGTDNVKGKMRLKESMMGLRLRQGNLRQVFRLFKSHPRLCGHTKKRSTSAYEEYELRIVENELRMLTYVRRTRDVPFVS